MEFVDGVNLRQLLQSHRLDLATSISTDHSAESFGDDGVSGKTVDISQIIDEQPLSRFQIKVIVLCAAALFMDGFDVTAMGYVAPGLSKLWSLKPGALARCSTPACSG